MSEMIRNLRSQSYFRSRGYCNEVGQLVQGGAEPTDTFQMVTDNIWKQEKICETVYKYVQVRYLLPTNYKLIF